MTNTAVEKLVNAILAEESPEEVIATVDVILSRVRSELWAVADALLPGADATDAERLAADGRRTPLLIKAIRVGGALERTI